MKGNWKISTPLFEGSGCYSNISPWISEGCNPPPPSSTTPCGPVETLISPVRVQDRVQSVGDCQHCAVSELAANCFLPNTRVTH
uniref:(California timema) hypothetical protein n=1 Tax=Timema californicum TaxID=61474 RepID=A0A7R9JKY8_TIMCA|nr:unnamed protein product [Timema californicum]